MIPILYPADEATKKSNAFKSNGLGGLGNATSCVVTEERNGTYELEMVYPVDGPRFKDLENDKLIYSDANETSGKQIFRIYSIEKPINGLVTIHAEHISYLLTKAVCLPFEAASAAGAFDKIENGIQWNTSNRNFPEFPFEFWTDSDSVGTIKIESPKSVRSILMGEEGSILDALGKGDYEFDNFLVKLYKQRGHDSKVSLRYGKNITDLKNTDDITNAYTGILPYWSGSLNETEDLPDANGQVVTNSVDTVIYITEASQEAYKKKKTTTTNYANGSTLWSANVSDYAYPLAIPVDLTSNMELEDDEEPNVPQGDGEDDATHAMRVIRAKQQHEQERKEYILEFLTQTANDYLTNNAGWKPSSNLEVSFVQLWQTEEYKEFAGLERVSLGDIVHVYYPKLDITQDLRVIKTEYNVLLDRYDSIELGDSKGSAAGSINSTATAADAADAELIKQLKQTESDLRRAINHASELLSGGLGGYVVFNKNAAGYPNEILIMDTPNKNTARHVIRMNLNGIGFSKNGYNGPFETAWTIDGRFNANWITTGVLTAIKIRTSTQGKRIVITDGEASIKGYDGNELHTTIDLLSQDGGTFLIDSDRTISLRTPTLLIDNVSRGDSEGAAYIGLTNQSLTAITGVTKYYANETFDGVTPSEGWVNMYNDDGTKRGSVYCTLPALLKISTRNNTVINGLVTTTSRDGYVKIW